MELKFCRKVTLVYLLMSIHYIRGWTGTLWVGVGIFSDTFKFLKLTKESVDFSAVFADELTEDLESSRVRKNSWHAVDVISFTSDDDSAALVRTWNYYNFFSWEFSQKFQIIFSKNWREHYFRVWIFEDIVCEEFYCEDKILKPGSTLFFWEYITEFVQGNVQWARRKFPDWEVEV